MTPEEFDRCFDRAERTVFRLETLQRYDIAGEQERIEAWRRGVPRPERSVRTSAWLRRVAVTTATQGKDWSRVHVVEHPLSEYLQYQLVGYVESAAAGEQIRIADRAAHADLESLTGDFWLFDADGPRPYAVLMHYDNNGRWLGADYTEDPEVLVQCRTQREMAVQHSIPLSAYLTEAGKARNAA